METIFVLLCKDGMKVLQRCVGIKVKLDGDGDNICHYAVRFRLDSISIVCTDTVTMSIYKASRKYTINWFHFIS